MVKSVIKKILEEATAKKSERPILKCVHYENGSAIASDSHRLVKFDNVNDNKNFTATIDASTLLPCNDQYPRTDFLIPSIDGSQVKITLDVEMIDYLVLFLKDNRKNMVAFNLSKKDDINITNKIGEKYHIKVEDVDYSLGEQFDGKPVLLNGKYLYEALRYLTKLGKERFHITGENHTDITITFYGQWRPMLITFLNMQYLIGPCRYTPNKHK